MATRELTGIGQAYQIPLNFGNRSSIVTANRRARWTEWMKGNILREESGNIEKEREFWDAEIWKNQRETIKMRFSSVDREESRIKMKEGSIISLWS